MRTLIVGSGGREHALAWKLAKGCEVHCAPGNPGIAQDCTVHAVSISDHQGLIHLAKSLAVDLVVVGPEDPLVLGLADQLRSADISAYGPGADGAQLEGSKAFAKQAMKEAGVPTAEFQSFQEAGAARVYAKARFDAGFQVAVKASGNALGKGVVVCDDLGAAEQAIFEMLEEGRLGEAGATVVVEDRLIGKEFSLLTLCSGTSFHSLPIAQDYKRVGNADTGPNTGGMGSVSPASWVSADVVADAEDRVVEPILRLLAERGVDFRGTLFSGLLVQDGIPYCLEYNVRFGDPETQSVMRRIGAGFGNALLASAQGHPIEPVEVLDNAVVTVVVASGGYPGDYRKGLPITIGPLPNGAKLFHSGTTLVNGQLSTAGGRVMGASGEAPTVEEARSIAYAAARAVQFDGAYFRTDIAS